MEHRPRTPAARRVLQTAARYFDHVVHEVGELLLHHSQDPAVVRVPTEHERERVARPRD